MGGWCSIDCMTFLERICVAGETTRWMAVGSKVSPWNLETKRESFGSSGNSSAIRASSLLICASSPYCDSYLWKKV